MHRNDRIWPLTVKIRRILKLLNSLLPLELSWSGHLMVINWPNLLADLNVIVIEYGDWGSGITNEESIEKTWGVGGGGTPILGHCREVPR